MASDRAEHDSDTPTARYGALAPPVAPAVAPRGGRDTLGARVTRRHGAAARVAPVEAPRESVVPESLDPATFLPMGRLIADRYRIVGVVGLGAMAAVYLAESLVDGQHVALKVMRGKCARRGEYMQRLGCESFALRSVKHPGVMRLLDEGHDAACGPFLALEYVPGEPLSAWLSAAQPLRPAVAVAITIRILEALSAVHAAGVVHRDIKPDNVLVSLGSGATLGDPVVKLVDFGISSLRPEAHAAPAGPDPYASTTIGTPAYMSPEQALGSSQVDARSDLYAVGATLYEMLTGALPIDGDNCGELLARVASGLIVPLARRAPELDPRLCAVVHRAMARRREDRFASAHEFARALRELRDDAPAMSPRAGRTVSGQRPTTRPMRYPTPMPVELALAGTDAELRQRRVTPRLRISSDRPTRPDHQK